MSWIDFDLNNWGVYPVTLNLDPSSATSAASVAVTAATTISPDNSSGSSTAAVSVTAPSRITLDAASGVSSASGSVTAPTTLNLVGASSVASASVSLTAASQLQLDTSSSSSTSQLSLLVSSVVAPDPTAGLSSDQMSFITGAAIFVSPAAISTASAFVVVPINLLLDPSNAVSSTRIALQYLPGPPGYYSRSIPGQVVFTRYVSHRTSTLSGIVQPTQAGTRKTTSPGHVR